MKKLFIGVLFSMSLFAQSQTVILPGDMKCTGLVQSDSSWGLDWRQNVQVAPRMTCRIPVVRGLYQISISMIEPLTSMVAGGRVFTVTINGHQYPNVDIFKLSGGAQLDYEISYFETANEWLIITFDAQVRTALWGKIIISPSIQ